ncbi:hypothetical protein [uncultured Enterococcus sp.]|uniref:hypothetical protein n=1 Tax=uncultured Enterococcus sp. TaxID=167972 RepID=UPI0025F6C07E|nr:hypothetical protein [uncultured Enterococcus sp.]
MKGYRRHYKLIFYFTIVFLIQLLVTQLRSYWIGEDQATISVLVVNRDVGEQGKQFEKFLEDEQYVTIQSDEDWTPIDYIKTKENVVVVIPKQFTKQVKQQTTQDLITVYLTPGIQDTQITLDMIQSNLLKIITSETYRLASNQEAKELSDTELFKIDYLDSESEETVYGATKKTISLPLIGLFYLPLLLMILTTIPSSQNKRLRFYGYRSILREQYRYFVVLTCLFLVEFSLFLIFEYFFLDRMLSILQIVQLFLFYGYLVLSSISLSYLKSSNWIYYGFIPWFILNLTVAGGLFETTILPAYLSFIFPIQNLVSFSSVWSVLNLVVLIIIVIVLGVKLLKEAKH